MLPDGKKWSLKLSPFSLFLAETTSAFIISAASSNWPLPKIIVYLLCTSGGIYHLQQIQHGCFKHENCEGEYHSESLRVLLDDWNVVHQFNDALS